MPEAVGALRPGRTGRAGLARRQVGPRAETAALGGTEHRADLVVGLELGGQAEDLGTGVRAEGVQPIRPVDLDVRHTL